MGITENIDRIEQGKTSIISSIKSKGVDVPSGVLINEIAPYINEIQGGGDIPIPILDYDYICIENLEDTDGTITFNKFLVNVEVSEDEFNTINETFNGRFTYPIKTKSKVWIRWYKLDFESSVSQNITVDKQHNISGTLKNGDISNAYSYMFKDNTKLVDASELKLTATILSENCYYSMFSNCSSLTSAPSLPATILSENCYYSMFSNCSSLTSAPSLPATILSENCYYSMFSNCSKINYVKTNIIDWYSYYTTDWLKGVASEGTVETPSLNITPSSVSGIPSGWTKKLIPTILDNEALILTNIADAENTFKVNMPSGSLYFYKINNDEWISESGKGTFTLNSGDKLYLIDVHRGASSETTSSAMITATANFKVSGVLPFGKTDYAYNYLFYNNTYLVDASELKLTSTTLGSYAYYGMFKGCSSLVYPPQILPATKLSRYCYYSMFSNCSSLTSAPILKSTTLSSYSLNTMFEYCSKINYVKTNIIEWNDKYTTYWLKGVASEGTVETPSLNITPSSVSGIPSGWTKKLINYDEM